MMPGESKGNNHQPFVFFILLSCLKRQGYSKPLRIIVSTRIVDYLKLI